MEKYEQPGERLVSKVPNKEYKDNYDTIFGNKESWLDRREREKKLRDCPNKEGGCFCTGVCMQEEHHHQGYYQSCMEQREEMQEKEKHDNCTD